MCVTALVASLNPAINPRQNSGSDSWEARPPYSQQVFWKPGTACQLFSLSWLAWCSPLHFAVGLAVGHPCQSAQSFQCSRRLSSHSHVAGIALLHACIAGSIGEAQKLL